MFSDTYWFQHIFFHTYNIQRLRERLFGRFDFRFERLDFPPPLPGGITKVDGVSVHGLAALDANFGLTFKGGPPNGLGGTLTGGPPYGLGGPLTGGPYGWVFELIF